MFHVLHMVFPGLSGYAFHTWPCNGFVGGLCVQGCMLLVLSLVVLAIPLRWHDKGTNDDCSDSDAVSVFRRLARARQWVHDPWCCNMPLNILTAFKR